MLKIKKRNYRANPSFLTALTKLKMRQKKFWRTESDTPYAYFLVIDTEEKIRLALPALQEMVSEGLVAMTDVEVLHHISGKKDR